MEARKRRSRNVTYGDVAKIAQVVFSEVSDRMCGKRLHVLPPSLVEAMKRYGHLALSEDVRSGVLAMSVATIDRCLRSVRAKAGRQRRRHVLSPSVGSRDILAGNGWFVPHSLPMFFSVGL